MLWLSQPSENISRLLWKGNLCAQLSPVKANTHSQPALGVKSILFSSNWKFSSTSNHNPRHTQAALITKAKLTPITAQCAHACKGPLFDLTSLRTDWATSTQTKPLTARLACSLFLVCPFVLCSPVCEPCVCFLSIPLYTDHLGGLQLSRYGHCVPV